MVQNPCGVSHSSSSNETFVRSFWILLLVDAHHRAQKYLQSPLVSDES